MLIFVHVARSLARQTTFVAGTGLFRDL